MTWWRFFALGPFRLYLPATHPILIMLPTSTFIPRVARQLRALPLLRVSPCSQRFFARSPIALAHKGSKKPKRGSPPTDAAKEAKTSAIANSEQLLELDLDKIAADFKAVVDSFQRQANEAKLGKANPKLFDRLKVEVDHNQVLPFTQVAQTTLKSGRNFIITVFDPAHTQAIINAVLGSGLNMNPQRDPANQQTLKVPLPPPTVESRKEAAKNLKDTFERLRHGAGAGSSTPDSGHGGRSLAGIRAAVKHDILKYTRKKKTQLSDSENRLIRQFEDLHKEYTDKLIEAYKAAEKAMEK